MNETDEDKGGKKRMTETKMHLVIKNVDMELAAKLQKVIAEHNASKENKKEGLNHE